MKERYDEFFLAWNVGYSKRSKRVLKNCLLATYHSAYEMCKISKINSLKLDSLIIITLCVLALKFQVQQISILS